MVVLEVMGLMVLLTAATAATARGQHGCTRIVGDYKYDLTQLAQAWTRGQPTRPT
jgi:hypothetical protein